MDFRTKLRIRNAAYTVAMILAFVLVVVFLLKVSHIRQQGGNNGAVGQSGNYNHHSCTGVW